jgi:hypothetical protein
MLELLTYADLLAIHNALSEKPARRFDTRTNGEKRTLALMEARGLTLEEAAHLANVVLGAGAATDREGPDDEPIDTKDDGPPDLSVPREAKDMTITVAGDIADLVNHFIVELTKSERPAYLAAFLRRLTSGKSPSPAPRERQRTASQQTIIGLCSRPEGATGKELAEGCGWPTIAARATCQKIADRFGYILRESPKANGRGISFRLTVKPGVEA